MKTLLLSTLVVGVAALAWFGFTHLVPKQSPVVVNAAAVAPTAKPVIPTTPPVTTVPAPVTNVTQVATPPTPAAVRAEAGRLAPAARPPVEKINLALSLDANGHYHDDLRGVSADLPPGWKIHDAQRWGEGNRQNTVWMEPDPPS